jgi:23S rRNA (adenine2030-N6)-methyltransferase
MLRAPGSLSVIDTHAGAGAYDLEGSEARKSGEAANGVVRLMADEGAPAVFAPLKAAVRAENPKGGTRVYPGSPALILGRLRAGDRFVGCELRPDDQDALARLVRARTAKGVQATALVADGYVALAEGRAGAGRRLVLIDPPFERGDEYARVVEAVRGDSRRGGDAVYMIWTPLKDLQTFDSFLGGVEGLGLPGLAVEARLRPLDQPLKLNGCSVVLLGSKTLLNAVEPRASAAAQWVATRLGDEGAQARIEALG